MDAETAVREIFHLTVAARGEIALEALQLAVRVLRRCRVDQVEDTFLGRLLAQHLRRFDRIFASVDKDHALMSGFDELGDLVEGGVVEVRPGLRAARLALDAEEMLLEWNGTERRVEEEEAGVPVHAAVMAGTDGKRNIRQPFEWMALTHPRKSATST